MALLLVRLRVRGVRVVVVVVVVVVVEAARLFVRNRGVTIIIGPPRLQHPIAAGQKQRLVPTEVEDQRAPALLATPAAAAAVPAASSVAEDQRTRRALAAPLRSLAAPLRATSPLAAAAVPATTVERPQDAPLGRLVAPTEAEGGHDAPHAPRGGGRRSSSSRISLAVALATLGLRVGRRVARLERVAADRADVALQQPLLHAGRMERVVARQLRRDVLCP